MEHNGRVKDNIDDLRDEISKLREEFSGISGKLGKMSRKAYAAGNEKLGGGLDTLRTMSAGKIDRAERGIAERPFLSLIVAFLLGVLAGKLIDRE